MKIAGRDEFSHWQLDTVVSVRGKNKSCETTFIERKTQFYWTISMLDRTADSMKQAIKTFVNAFDNRKAFLSFTVYRGKEFSFWAKIETDLNIPMYFCDPYSSFQRGYNKNGNEFSIYT